MTIIKTVDFQFYLHAAVELAQPFQWDPREGAMRGVNNLHPCSVQIFWYTNVNWARNEQEASWVYSTQEILNYACLFYTFIQNQAHLLCSYFWFHATSTLEYHPSGDLDHAGQPPSATSCFVPSWTIQMPPCMPFPSNLGHVLMSQIFL